MEESNDEYLAYSLSNHLPNILDFWENILDFKKTGVTICRVGIHIFYYIFYKLIFKPLCTYAWKFYIKY